MHTPLIWATPSAGDPQANNQVFNRGCDPDYWHVSLQQRVWSELKVCASMPLIPNDLELRDLLVLATMLQGLHAKIQVRNLYF